MSTKADYISAYSKMVAARDIHDFLELLVLRLPTRQPEGELTLAESRIFDRDEGAASMYALLRIQANIDFPSEYTAGIKYEVGYPTKGKDTPIQDIIFLMGRCMRALRVCTDILKTHLKWVNAPALEYVAL